jgi:hypothetical protein
MKKEKSFSHVYLLMALLLVLLSSCNSSGVEINDFPPVNLPESAMNKVIQIETLPQFGNSYKNNNPLDLHVKNLSDKTFVFSYNTSVFLFREADGNWVEVKNNMHYPSELLYLFPKKIDPPGIVISTLPYIPHMVGSQIVRIIVVGHYENSESDLVGAYLDVTIKP